MVVVERLWRDDGGVGQNLVDNNGKVHGTLKDLWRGGKPPVGALVKIGSSRYPKYYKVMEDQQ